MSEYPPAPETVVRQVVAEDLSGLQPILEHWLRDQRTSSVKSDEVEGVLAAIQGSIDGTNGRTYLVAEHDDGTVSGIMGMKTPDTDMLSFACTLKPVELINAYVDPNSRNQGVGKALAAQLEALAKQAGASEIIVNSGPRYKETGWNFWTALYDEPVATAIDFYGEGVHAQVWRKALELA